MRHAWWLPPLLLPALAAQESSPPTPPESAVLERRFAEAQKTWNDRYREASEAKDQAAQKQLVAARPEAEFAPQFQAGADAHAGKPEAVPYLCWLVSRGGSDVARASLTTLMEHHVDDPGIRPAVARIGGLHHVWGKDQSQTWLDLVLERNQDTAVRAQAHYTRGAMYVGTRAVEHSEALRKQAIADLLDTMALAGADRSLTGLATSLLHEARYLEPGLKAPDIEGEDLEGKAFKLSDYKGKVVLLDFWGDW
jgi:hypothetical protein